MERENLLTRERSKEDRRVVYIKLTAKGRRLAEEIPVEPMEIFRGALESLSAAEVRDPVKILGKVARRAATDGPSRDGRERRPRRGARVPEGR